MEADAPTVRSETRLTAPTLSLPKGGGALRGIGEKFTANPVTGTAAVSVPITTTPGRQQFGPSLSLSYDSGRGNGTLGFGWTLDLPDIRRSTERGLPTYRDDIDVFVLAGTEDLVAVTDAGGIPIRRRDIAPGYTVVRYRPRVDTSYLRIERWVREDDGDTHWRVYGSDNVLTIYGKNPDSRIAQTRDDGSPSRVFAWVISEARDCFGNVIVYTHKAEDGEGADLSAAHQRNRGARGDASRSANRHLKSIRYGNDRPFLDPQTGRRPVHVDSGEIAAAHWMFELVVDYGEHGSPSPVEDTPWAHRADAFSDYRAGFEMRVARLCRRFLMFHDVPDVPGESVGYRDVVSSTELTYTQSEQGYAYLNTVTHIGYQPDAAGGHRTGSLPPLEFDYTTATLEDRPHLVDAAAFSSLPAAALSSVGLVDLRGDGLPGVLASADAAWHFAPNLTPATGQVQFGAVSALPTTPNAATPRFVDLAGDGTLDAVVFDGPTPGFSECRSDLSWTDWRLFDAVPRIDVDGDSARFVDLTGDGRSDVMITTKDGRTLWYPSLGERGFGSARPTEQAGDDERGPMPLFSDDAAGLHLADMCGDGLADLVRIENSEVCYWPNLGYGRFGAKVVLDIEATLDGEVTFDHPDRFDPSRIRLVDVDGSGTVDIVYLHSDGAKVYLNCSGNSLARPVVLTSLASVADPADVTAADLLGTGTAYLVWLSREPSDSGREFRFVDLMGAKPHLLRRVTNNLGAVTEITYSTSTKAAVDDELAGRRWPTPLPFCVHVVARIDTQDLISGTTQVERYAYRDGCYDGREREFRGFGFVERWDAEIPLGDRVDDEDLDLEALSLPVHTKTWFHTGTAAGVSTVLGWGPRHVDDRLVTTGPPIDAAEAARALKGAKLREEVWGAGGAPFVVTEQGYTVEQVQPPGAGRFGVYRRWLHDTMAFHHEQRPEDPRIAQSLIVAIDDYGTPVQTVDIAYGRTEFTLTPTEAVHLNAEERARQATTLITHDHTVTTNPVDSPAPPGRTDYPLDYRFPEPAEHRRYELTGAQPETSGTFAAGQFAVTLLGVEAIPSDQQPTPGRVQKRLISHVRNRFRSDPLDAVLPVGTLQPRGLRHESERLAFTAGMLAVHGPDGADDVLTDEGGYRGDPDGTWWIPSGEPYYSPSGSDSASDEFAYAVRHFFHPMRYRDPFGAQTTVTFDGHDLLAIASVDAAGNRVAVGQTRPDGSPDPLAGNDYRVLQPQTMTDQNCNRTAVSFDPLGMVEATAVMGKAPPAPAEGDSLASLPALDDDLLGEFLSDPVAHAAFILGTATSRKITDVNAFHRSGTPAAVYTIGRARHGAAPGHVSVAIGFSDGFGREVQTRVRAPDDAAGPRWAVTGWKRYDNKGDPVREYEPFFSPTHEFQPAVEQGVSAILCYDPVRRPVAAINPDHSWSKTVFTAWRQQSWDCTDTLMIANPGADEDVGEYVGRLPSAEYLPTWHAARAAGALGERAKACALEAVANAATPTTEHLDALGRVIIEVTENSGDNPVAVQRFTMDVEGRVTAVRGSANPAVTGRLLRTCSYDLVGTSVTEGTVDDGVRRMLVDCVGAPLRESIGDQVRRTRYDALRRPTEVWVDRGADRRLVRRLTYGESQGSVGNHRGRVHRSEDGAGRKTLTLYDFKGNPLAVERELLLDYRAAVNWATGPPVENVAYGAALQYDASNRPVLSTTPDGRVEHRVFDVAGQLTAVTSAAPGDNGESLLTTVEYDAHGRRSLIEYGNGVRTEYTYDPLTFRLARQRSTRAVPAEASPIFASATVLQDLRYTYDASGNVVDVEDAAQATVMHNQQNVVPVRHFVYDARHRLVQARGREHIGQNDFAAPIPGRRRDHPFVGRVPGANDLQALRNFTQFYDYDERGNVAHLRHVAGAGGWNRGYAYAEDSRLEPGVATADRLSRTTIGDGADVAESYGYADGGNDAGGCITTINAMALHWSFGDQLDSADLGGGGTVYYAYDDGGQRVRKVIDSQGGSRQEEHLYLDGYEVRRQYTPQGAVSSERRTVHVADGVSRLALIETLATMPDDPILRYQLADHVGTCTVEVDAAGALISYEECHPFGTSAFQVSMPNELSTKRFRYLGKERDNETGLYYYGARYYLPWVGRWLSCDPDRTDLAAKLYEYCRGNPVTLVDPNGREDLPAVVGKQPDCSTTKVHPKLYAQPPGHGLKESAKALQKEFVDGTLWVMSAGGVSSIEESKKNYDATKNDPSLPPQGKATPITNDIVNQTPSASGELYLAWAGAAGKSKPPASGAAGAGNAIGGAAKMTVADYARRALSFFKSGAPLNLEVIKDMLRATKRLVSEVATGKADAALLLEGEVDFVLEKPTNNAWASYGGTKADTVTWDKFKSPATGKVRVSVDPQLMKMQPKVALQKMAHELHELQGIKRALAEAGGEMSGDSVRELIKRLHTEAIEEEGHVLADWIATNKQAQGAK